MARYEVIPPGAAASDSEYATVRLEIDSDVACVTLDRPEVRNAFNVTMIAELTTVFEDLASRDGIIAVVLRGAGASLCAGADVKWMRESLGYSHEENVEDARRMAAMFETINAAPQPTIALVQGAALGGGIGLVAACDIAIAAEDAMFGFTETKLGIVPAVISEVVLPKIGQSWARALYVTGERFSAEMARNIGLVHWLSASVDLETILDAKVAEIRSAGPRASRIAKSLARDAGRLDPESLRDYLVHTIAAARTSDEGQEGLRAFLEKRLPTWRR